MRIKFIAKYRVAERDEDGSQGEGNEIKVEGAAGYSHDPRLMRNIMGKHDNSHDFMTNSTNYPLLRVITIS